jgi:hypothetical protein
MSFFFLEEKGLVSHVCGVQRSSSRIGMVRNDVGGKDNEFLSFINKKRNKSHHLISWSQGNLMICEGLGKGLGKGIDYARERRITPSAPYLCFKSYFYSLVYLRFEKNPS